MLSDDDIRWHPVRMDGHFQLGRMVDGNMVYDPRKFESRRDARRAAQQLNDVMGLVKSRSPGR